MISPQLKPALQPRNLLIASAALAIGALTLKLSTNGAAYITLALALLIVQNKLHREARALWQRLRGWLQPYKAFYTPLHLSKPDDAIGGKSRNLARLGEAGFPILPALTMTGAQITELFLASPAIQSRIIARLYRQLGSPELALRSSAEGEDGTERSFAGVFESVLNVREDGFLAALKAVVTAFEEAEATAYSEGGAPGAFAVLIQPMMAPDYAGVIFTEDPSQPLRMRVEYVTGLAEDLVSGSVTPMQAFIGRLSLKAVQPESAEAAQLPLATLGQLAKRVENLFGCPQDIEWGYANGSLTLLQARPITTPVLDAKRAEAEEAAHLMPLIDAAPADSALFVQDDLSALLPHPTPLSLSLMQKIWGIGGSVDLAAIRLGLRYPATPDTTPHLQCVMGRLYSYTPAIKEHQAYGNERSRKHLLARAEMIQAHAKEVFLPQFHDRLAYLRAIDPAKLPTAKLWAMTLEELQHFATKIHQEAEVVNIAAEACSAALSAQDHAQLAVHYANAPTELARLYAADPHPELMERLIDKIAHRAAVDYELSYPRFGEDRAATAHYIEELSRIARQAPRNIPPEAKAPLSHARALIQLKEEMKDEVLRHLACLRSWLLELDRRLFAGQDEIFYMRLDELLAQSPMDLSVRALKPLRATLQKRQRQRRAMLAYDPPGAELTASDIEAALMGKSRSKGAHPRRDQEQGEMISACREVTGKARIIKGTPNLALLKEMPFEQGDILICHAVRPDWLPLFMQAGAIVSRAGGWLSHVAIVAREHQIPMLIGVDYTQTFHAGQMITLTEQGQLIDAQPQSQPQFSISRKEPAV